jgi:hypothetical protein
MNISGLNQPEPCYGLGCAGLVERWIAREDAMVAAGMDTRQIKMMRRELQDASNLVVSPEHALARAEDRARFLVALRTIVAKESEEVSVFDLIWANDDERAEAWKRAREQQ